ncbi:alpha/beta hydrolase [Aquincola sp. S2]|uniref:Alpha/beta hydrolase n=1 Tax=Pseudaquabacterium terrae TaxID=2732868 RepID=A0ABX2EGJ0_9BURK|nr:alpha/beta hydrolase [Aquabacterium terrae]NRF67742.1 alpha/beta hydrolase [Aquabacterium terrae]
MLDLQLAAMMKAAHAAGMPDLCDLPLPASRDLYRQICAAADRPPADVGVADHAVPAAGALPAIPLRVYTPRAAGPHGIVVYYHGGGYMLGDIAAYDNVCRQLCEDSGAVVVSVEYRLAPEHAFPAAADDAWAALGWAAEHARSLGADPARLAVAGDSAGAVLASTVALLARDAGFPAIRLQALLYPPAAGGHDGDYPSRARHAAGPTLTLRTMAHFSAHAFGASGRAADFRGAPLLARSLAGLPPTLLVLAGHDPLRDEGVAFADALLAAGTPVQLVEWHGLAHGFIVMAGGITAARQAQRQFGLAVRDALALPGV